ncbi:MAG: ATP-binding protein [Lachnospiraceae bacterium]|nr:ATP-binding protein [Lachnospiraceae bacterium]
MIIMDIKVDNMYAFQNFHMNMSYPKKIVDSTIENEFLEDRPNFRYKKVNIIMGGNATGKTTLGKLLMAFTNYFVDGSYSRFTNVIDDSAKPAGLTVDFVTDENALYRFEMVISPKQEERYTESNVNVQVYCTPIGLKDSYETCAKRLDENLGSEVSFDTIVTKGWYFTYPQDVYNNKTYCVVEEEEKYIYILEQTLKTLDPSIEKVIKISELENAYAIKLRNRSVIIKDGAISQGEVLSSGTKAGLDISYVIASLMCDLHDLYYCDELFSYVNSDVEKACLSIFIDKLTDRKQLFFTTHNTDILDMQLPKHSFFFLKKDVSDVECPIKCINAAQYLKRNTDSLKHAVENDLFCTAPELHRLYEITEV